MTFSFRPAASYTDRHGLFVALVGGPGSGKTYSALRLARGIAGPAGKIAVADTEGGRTLHLKKEFAFDVAMVDPPHRPQRYADLARDAENGGYAALVIDSFSAEWAGIGGVLSWADEEATRMAGDDAAKRERVKGATWIKPKMAHKTMVYSLLERRMPIIFSIRGEETFVPPNTKLFKPICNKAFMFEVTVSFRLASDRKGVIDLSDPTTYKMEGSHRDIFKGGELLSEKHGEALAAWATGGAATAPAARPLAQQHADADDFPGDRPSGEPASDEPMSEAEVKAKVAEIRDHLAGLRTERAIDNYMRGLAPTLLRIKAASERAYDYVMVAQTKATDAVRQAT